MLFLSNTMLYIDWELPGTAALIEMHRLYQVMIQLKTEGSLHLSEIMWSLED